MIFRPWEQQILNEIPSLGDGPAVYKALVDLFPGGSFAEVGVWFGRSACELGLLARPTGGRIYAVDHFETAPTLYGKPRSLPVRTLIEKHGSRLAAFQHFLKELAIENTVYPVVGRSVVTGEIFAREVKFDAVFIDASHRYSDVREDLKVWWEAVRHGGVLAGHDYDIAGVRRAVDEFVSVGSGRTPNFYTVDKRSWWIEKGEAPPPQELIREAKAVRKH